VLSALQPETIARRLDDDTEEPVPED